LLSNTFTDHATNSIAATQTVQSDHDDILRWTPAKNGLCTTKAIYKHLSSQQLIPLPTHGSRSISQNANQILQKAWNSKTLPPLLKTFAWRLIRRALATAERAGRYSTHTDQHYTYCGAIENDFHLFFLCDLPRAVWSTANPAFTIDNIPAEDDGIQLTLPLLITPNSSDELLCKTFFTMWYIWKARNDNRFQRKTWHPWQVHHAVVAHLNTHMTALWEVTEGTEIQQPLPTSDPIITNPATLLPNQGMNISNAGINQTTEQENRYSTTMLDRFLVPFPVLLEGSRCYTDASTQPDLVTPIPREAGIGIFIVNTQVHPPQSIFIKAAMKDSSSVFMAEAAALALAVTVVQELHLQHINFLSDNQQLVHFLNGSDHSNPPDWRIKPFTQIISSTMTGRRVSIRKIRRTQNQTADLLARRHSVIYIPINIVSHVSVLTQLMTKSVHYIWHSKI
jgi:ribonuclease HI